MTFLNLYHNLSGFELYKEKICQEIGVHALLIFNLNGIPFIARDYQENERKTSTDYIFVSAFISSVLKFIKVEEKSYFTDFGIGNSRYYLKFDHQNTVYCLILSERLHKRVVGENYVMFVEVLTHEIRKLFQNYQSKQKNLNLEKEEFDENFCLLLDKIFLKYYEELIKSEFDTKQRSRVSKDNFVVNSRKHKVSQNLQGSLSNYGINGMILCGTDSNSHLDKLYSNEKQGFLSSPSFICGLSNLLNKYALTNYGYFTDIGFFYKRLMFKFKTKNNVCLCLLLSELLFRRLTGETLTMFVDLILNGMHKKFAELPSLKTILDMNPESEEYTTLSKTLDEELHKLVQQTISDLTTVE